MRPYINLNYLTLYPQSWGTNSQIEGLIWKISILFKWARPTPLQWQSAGWASAGRVWRQPTYTKFVIYESGGSQSQYDFKLRGIRTRRSLWNVVVKSIVTYKQANELGTNVRCKCLSIGNAVSRVTFDFPFCGRGRVRRVKPFRMGGPVLRF